MKEEQDVMTLIRQGERQERARIVKIVKKHILELQKKENEYDKGMGSIYMADLLQEIEGVKE